MAYQALYRKWRPQTFEQVLGQTATVKTLRRQIQAGRVAHAYLFCGCRGTGKTTMAKLMSRAINCLNPHDGDPCGQCEACRAIMTESTMDVLELDAASNNSVDNIRELLEQVRYPAQIGKYKVYIIDEVHMLTASAFNALLKTLEEPPSHAIFILATTEVHKLPATVLSRCMRFDFRLVPQPTLKEYLRRVYAAENVTADEEALDLIAAAADGSVRDMLSIADRCMNYSDKLGYDDVAGVLGAGGKESTRELFGAIARSDIAATLELVDGACAAGKSVGLIAKDVAAYARDLLVLKTSEKASVLGSHDEIERMRKEAEDYSVELLVSVVTIFSNVDAELRYSVSPRIVLECAALKAAKLAVADYSAIEERLTRLERAVKEGAVAQPAAIQPVRAVQAPEAARRSVNKDMDAKSVWGRLLTWFRTHESAQVFALINRVTDVEVRGDKLILWAEADSFMRLSGDDVRASLERALREDGAPYTLVINKKSGGVDMDSEIARIKKMIGDAKVNVKK